MRVVCMKSLVIQVLILAMLLVPTAASAQDASSPSTPVPHPDGIELDWVGIEDFEGVGIVGLLTAELEPGLPLTERTSGGTFTMRVLSGGTCHKFTHASDDVIVLATIVDTPNQTSNPCGAEATAVECTTDADTDSHGCQVELQPGQLVYLPEGSTLARSGYTNSSFSNPESAPTVLLFAEFYADDDGGACRGGCF